MTIPKYVRTTCEWCGSPGAQIENTDYLLEGRFRVASCPDCDWIREYDNRGEEQEADSGNLTESYEDFYHDMKTAYFDVDAHE